MPDLTLTGSTKSFGDNTVLHGLDLHVADGEFFTLLGPSGCGKSTTLWSIAGLHSPRRRARSASGTASCSTARGVDLPPEARNCGVVFQSYAVWPHLTVADNVGYPLKLRKTGRRERAARVHEVLELVELDGLAKRYPHELAAASSSGSRWPGRWRTRRTCCCSTSRSRTSTPSCASGPGTGCASCSSGSA